MSTPSPAQFDWGTFSGRVRLFPIPGMVMFPHVLCPLHVFEPRYRRLTQAALAGDQLIAIPTLSDDAVTGEVPSDAKLDAVACLGRIASHHRLADGRYTLLLQGIGRVRLHEELTSTLPFREARADGVADVYPGGDVDDLECRRLRDDVLARLGKSLSLQAGGNLMVEIAHSSVPLGMLADIAAFAMQLPPVVKRQLLAEVEVVCRARRLLDAIPPTGDGRYRLRTPTFPPEFGVN